MPRGVYKRIKLNWNKGLTKETDARVVKNAIAISIGLTGVPKSPEAIINMTKAQNCPDLKAVKSAALTGRTLSPEHCKAISVGQIKRYEDPKEHEKVSIAVSGEKNPNWQGGVGKLPYPFAFNNKLKELIRERDGHICQLCSKTQEENGRKLDVHHKDYIKDNLDPKNLISLCISCNCKVNYNRECWVEFFSSKNRNKK